MAQDAPVDISKQRTTRAQRRALRGVKVVGGRKFVRNQIQERRKAETPKNAVSQVKVLKSKGDDTKAKLFTRQVQNLDPFSRYYDQYRLLIPPYAFINLYQMVEESDVLTACINAMVQNIHGFGYRLNFLKDDHSEKDTPEAKAEFIKLTSFFDQTNDEQAFINLRKLVGKDYEVLGNACVEIIRDGANQIIALNHIPARSMRMTEADENPVMVNVTVTRNGKEVTYPKRVNFRKYAQLPPNKLTPIWFKEFGDERELDYKTGLYHSIKTPVSEENRATEVLWIKQEFAGYPYGMPKWIGAMLEVLGRRSAQYVNFDLFENQGVPPFLVLISNGVLTDESWEDLEEAMDSWRGLTKFNRAAVLESAPESTGIDEKGTAKIEIKSLNEFRKEDQMFQAYLQNSEKSIRRVLRLPPLYSGGTDDYNKSTANASLTVADQQIFSPERLDFDTIINNKLVRREFKCKYWEFVSLGPQLVGGDELVAGVSAFSTTGAISINRSVQLANQAFNLQISEYEHPWANQPLPLVIAMIQKGLPLVGLDDCFELDEEKRKHWIAPAPEPPPGFGGDLSGGLGGALANMAGTNSGKVTTPGENAPTNPLEKLPAAPNGEDLTVKDLSNQTSSKEDDQLLHTLCKGDVELYKRLLVVEAQVKSELARTMAIHKAGDHNYEL